MQKQHFTERCTEITYCKLCQAPECLNKSCELQCQTPVCEQLTQHQPSTRSKAEITAEHSTPGAIKTSPVSVYDKELLISLLGVLKLMNTLELFYNETELKSMDEVPILWVITASQMNHKATALPLLLDNGVINDSA